MQILNHYFGGSVENLNESIVEDHKAADFSQDVDHSGKPSQFHTVEDLNGTLTSVNSRHHQHCNILATNFKATHLSYPMYGVVEGFEDLDRMIWAVQWHPEKMESEDNEYPLGKLTQRFRID
jgi:gamma-glutamyl-gamma-aminobutyrate hydrolase PuuD